MSDVLSAAAAALGLPEALVQRSAAARASETGGSVDDILAAWAGGEAAPAISAPAAAAEPPAAAAEPEEQAAPPSEPSPAPAAVIAAAPTAPVATTYAPVPAEVTPAEAANLPEVVTVPTAGIRERTNFRIPKWLVAAMLIIPTFALFAMGGSATGACGDATELSSDVITGEIVNCDGSEFTGSGVGGGEVNFIALGEGIYQGTEVSGVNCAGCHGAGGAGSGAGPALTGVLTTFGSCSDHIEWVTIGTPGFQAEGRSTYGDTNKPVGGAGVMPPHASLSEEQLAAVSAFERVRFGGGDTDAVLSDCGLAEDAEGGDEAGEGAENGAAESGEASTEAVAQAG